MFDLFFFKMFYFYLSNTFLKSYHYLSIIPPLVMCDVFIQLPLKNKSPEVKLLFFSRFIADQEVRQIKALNPRCQLEILPARSRVVFFKATLTFTNNILCQTT